MKVTNSLQDTAKNYAMFDCVIIQEKSLILYKMLKINRMFFVYMICNQKFVIMPT